MDAQLIMNVHQMQDRAAWLKLRNEGIGGSDAGTIVGDNTWKSPYALWLEKTGRWCWKIYLGWKLQRSMLTDYQAMIATRLWIGRK